MKTVNYTTSRFFLISVYLEVPLKCKGTKLTPILDLKTSRRLDVPSKRQPLYQNQIGFHEVGDEGMFVYTYTVYFKDNGTKQTLID